MVSIADYSKKFRAISIADFRAYELSKSRKSKKEERDLSKLNLARAVEDLAETINGEISELIENPKPQESSLVKRYKGVDTVPDIVGRTLVELKSSQLTDNERLNQLLNIIDRICSLPISPQGHILEPLSNFTKLKSQEIDPNLVQLTRAISIEPLVKNLLENNEPEDTPAYQDEADQEKTKELNNQKYNIDTYLGDCGSIAYIILRKKLEAAIEALESASFESKTDDELTYINQVDNLLLIFRVLSEDGSIPKDQGRKIQALCLKIIDLIGKQMIQELKKLEADDENEGQECPKIVFSKANMLSTAGELFYEFGNLDLELKNFKTLRNLILSRFTNLSIKIPLLQALSNIKINGDQDPKLNNYLSRLVINDESNPLAKLSATKFLMLNPTDDFTLLDKLIKALGSRSSFTHAKTILLAWSQDPELKDFIKIKMLDELKEYFEKEPSTRNFLLLNDILDILAPLLENSSDLFPLLLTHKASNIESLYLFAAIKRFNDFETQITQKLTNGALRNAEAFKLRQSYADFEQRMNSNDDSILANDFVIEQQELNVHKQTFYQLRLLANYKIKELEQYLAEDKRTQVQPLTNYFLVSHQNINIEAINNLTNGYAAIDLMGKRLASLEAQVNIYQNSFDKYKREAKKQGCTIQDFNLDFNSSCLSTITLNQIRAKQMGVKSSLEDLLNAHSKAFEYTEGENQEIQRINDVLYENFKLLDSREGKTALLKISDEASRSSRAGKYQAQLASKILDDVYYLPDINYSTAT